MFFRTMAKQPGDRARALVVRLQTRGVTMQETPNNWGDLGVLQAPAKARTLCTMAESLFKAGDTEGCVSSAKKCLLLMAVDEVRDPQIEVDLIQRAVIAAAKALFRGERGDEAMSWMWAATYAGARHGALATFARAKAQAMGTSHKKLELLHLSTQNGNRQAGREMLASLSALRNKVSSTMKGRLGTGAEAGTLIIGGQRGAGPPSMSQNPVDTVEEQVEAPGPRIVDVESDVDSD